MNRNSKTLNMVMKQVCQMQHVNPGSIYQHIYNKEHAKQRSPSWLPSTMRFQLACRHTCSQAMPSRQFCTISQSTRDLCSQKPQRH